VHPVRPLHANPHAVDTICTGCSKGCSTTGWLKAKPEWAKGARLIRMTPRYNPQVNDYWMCDIGRFNFGWVEGDTRLRRPEVRTRDGAVQQVTCALARVRDVLMPDSTSGARLLGRYAQFSPEVVAMMRTDPTLWRDAAATLGLWTRPLRDLVDGRGASRAVDQAMVDAVDAFLQRLASNGSPALAGAIADERSRLPAFNALVGLSMTEFRDVALPPDLVLRDGFEAP